MQKRSIKQWTKLWKAQKVTKDFRNLVYFLWIPFYDFSLFSISPSNRGLCLGFVLCLDLFHDFFPCPCCVLFPFLALSSLSSFPFVFTPSETCVPVERPHSRCCPASQRVWNVCLSFHFSN